MDIKQAREVKRRVERYLADAGEVADIRIRPSTLTSRIGAAGYQVEYRNSPHGKVVVHDADYLSTYLSKDGLKEVDNE